MDQDSFFSWVAPFRSCCLIFILGMVAIASLIGCSPPADKEVKQMDNDFDNGLPEIDAPPATIRACG